MLNPKAVLISDIHFNLKNLDLASTSLQMAFHEARRLKIPLIVAGDTHDSKASIRAECSNAMIKVFLTNKDILSYVLIGNHCLINERGSEHALEFLKPYTNIVDFPYFDSSLRLHFIPYQTSTDTLLYTLERIPSNSTIIAHQGLQTAYMGEYVQDKTSLPPEAFAPFRTISGHYHRRQDIKCGKTGLFSYIGTPYTTSFAEANDGPKGFQILNDDGTLDFIPTNLRKHIIIKRSINTLYDVINGVNKDDIVWLKVTGKPSELSKIDKKIIGQRLFGHLNFKLDLIPTESEVLTTREIVQDASIVLDELIEDLPETENQKSHLKLLWREVVNASS